ncbi:hypothetical protein [Nocardia sp. NPDC004722]
MAQFLRPIEAVLLESVDPRGGSLIEELVVRSNLAPEEVQRTLAALQRRSLVRLDGAHYSLTRDGEQARSDMSAVTDSGRGADRSIFVLDDAVEDSASSYSEAELNTALDRELGPLDRTDDGDDRA